LKPVVEIMKKLKQAKEDLRRFELNVAAKSYVEGWRDALKWVLGEEETKRR